MPTIYPQAEERDISKMDEVPVSPYAKDISKKAKLKLIDALKRDKKTAKLLKFHYSLCPDCVSEGRFSKMKIPALTYKKGNEVWMVKVCNRHGIVKEVYWEDFDLYKKAERFQDPGLCIKPYIIKHINEINCPLDCGLCPAHESHTGLGNIVLTNRCDLSCWYCFFYAKEGERIYEPTLGQIRVMLEKLRNQQPVKCNAVQLTGGEPCLRDDLIDIIKLAKEVGFEHVQVNTNGIRLSKEPDLAKNIFNAGSHVLYLSFDGVTPKTNPKNYWEIPDALENCRKAKIGVVLVPTIINGVNDHEVGDMIRFAMGNLDVVRAINFQPVSFVGRIKERKRRKERITIPGTIKRIEEQTNGEITKDDFYPVPFAKFITDFIEVIKKERKYRLSAHFACGMATYVFKDGKKMVPITRFFDVEGFAEYINKLIEEIKERGYGRIKKYLLLLKVIRNIKKFIDNEKKPKDLKFTSLLSKTFLGANYKGLGAFHHKSLFIGMMHFQDPYNYDTDRVHKCCIHYATPDEKLIPFCTFNVIPKLYRENIHKKFGVTIRQWEKMTKKRFGEEKYRRRLTKEKKRMVIEFYNRSLEMKSLEKTKIERKGPITKDMAIADIIEKYPETVEIFLEKGIHCIGCSVASIETLEQGLKGHGYGKKEIEKIVKELNKKVGY